MKIKSAVLTLFLSVLAACQQTPSEPQTENVSCVTSNSGSFAAVLADKNKGWSECFDHQQSGLFVSVAKQIQLLAQNNDIQAQALDDLMYYLRAYSYYGSINKLNEADWQALNNSLVAVTGMSELYTNSQASQRIQEHLAVTLYQYGWQDKSKLAADFIAQTQASLVKNMAQETSKAGQYKILETYRSIGFLAYQARRNKTLKAALTSKDNALVNNLTAHLLSNNNKGWQLDNSLWALASLHYVMPEEAQKTTDKQVIDFMFNHPNLNELEKKQLFSQNYLVNSYRYHEQCDDDFKDQCLIPNIDEVLPVNHVCSDTLFIRATAMTKDELNVSCQKLTSQESFFHQTINSNHQPVADDLNSKLRVVIFDNYSEYNRWGQLLFNISTDNGGMYIEGAPEKAGNQATFYSFEAFWQQPTFAVWNLNHEYVHYLDGRFVKYGTFGHYPSHLVWWSEGMAEYISVQKQNKKAFELLNKTERKEWPNLDAIFATSYGDGTDRIYRWSYLAVRYIFENHPTSGQAMAKALKADNFDQYKKLLDGFSQQHQANFEQWLMANKPKQESAKPVATDVKHYRAKPLYRYLYRSYLRPVNLPISEQHKHFSNWG